LAIDKLEENQRNFIQQTVKHQQATDSDMKGLAKNQVGLIQVASENQSAITGLKQNQQGLINVSRDDGSAISKLAQNQTSTSQNQDVLFQRTAQLEDDSKENKQAMSNLKKAINDENEREEKINELRERMDHLEKKQENETHELREEFYGLQESVSEKRKGTTMATLTEVSSPNARPATTTIQSTPSRLFACMAPHRIAELRASNKRKRENISRAKARMESAMETIGKLKGGMERLNMEQNQLEDDEQALIIAAVEAERNEQAEAEM